MYSDARFWPAMKAAGMLKLVQWLAKGTATVVDAWVVFKAPDDVLSTGVVSRTFTMEYQHADLPTLAQGDSVLIGEAPDVMRFEVREPPVIEDGNPNGYFRTVKLTRK